MATEELKGADLDALLEQLQQRLERLRILYEQFFIGIEKQPPMGPQKEVVRLLARLQRAQIRSAAGKFKFQTLQQRFNSHRAYWQRTMREIEEGRYKRQTFRAQERRRQQQEERARDKLTTADHIAIRMIKDIEGEEAAAAAAEARREARKAELSDAASGFMDQLGATGTIPGAVVEPEPAPATSPAATASAASAEAAQAGRKPAPEIRGMSQQEILAKADKLREMRHRVQAGTEAISRRRAAKDGRPVTDVAPAPVAATRDVDREVFERFVAAKQRLNQDTAKLSYEAVAKSLESQRAKVRQKHDCARVEFDVVVKDRSRTADVCAVSTRIDQQTPSRYHRHRRANRGTTLSGRV